MQNNVYFSTESSTMLKVTTHICKVTVKTLGVQPKSSCQSVHMSLLYYFDFFQRVFKFTTLLSCYSLNKHMGKCLLVSKYQHKRWGYTRGEKTSFGWFMVLWKKQMRSQVLSALRQRQTWEDRRASAWICSEAGSWWRGAEKWGRGMG